jgi:hypothetical protein
MSDRPTEPDVETLWEGEVPAAETQPSDSYCVRLVGDGEWQIQSPTFGTWHSASGEIAGQIAAHLATQLRDLQQAAREYRAASDELAAADAAYRLAGMSSDRGAYKDASSRLTTAEARLHAHDATLAALLPPPAEPTKETP